MADFPIDLGAALAPRLAQCLDVEAKIPRALQALGPLDGRDVVLLEAGSGLRARQLAAIGARLTIVDRAARLDAVRASLADVLDDGVGHRLEAGDGNALGLEDASADVLISLWSGFRAPSAAEVVEAERVLRPAGRILALHDYGRDDVSRLRGPDLPEYGPWSRRDGWFLQNGFKVRVIHCWWTWPDLEEARAFLREAFGGSGEELGASLRRPRLSYNVAIYHRSRAVQMAEEGRPELAGSA